MATPADGVHTAQATGPAAPVASASRSVYLSVLTWTFTLFNSLRIFSYMPTIWAIHVSGDSSQHSIWTWCIWLGANATMAAWLFEQSGRRITRAAVVNMVNAAMCAATLVLIAGHRFWP